MSDFKNNIMKADKAIQRLITRFSGGNAITPNDADRAALKSIVSNYNDQGTEINFSQEPFAKLYLFLYFNLLYVREYEDPNLKPAQMLQNVLDRPLMVLLSDITERLNANRSNKVIKDKINSFDLSKMNDDEYKLYKKEVEKPDLDKLIDAHLSYEDVSDQLMSKVNQLLEDYK
jgi:hypothetical protein